MTSLMFGSGDVPEPHPLGSSWIISDFSYRVAEQQYEEAVVTNKEETNDYELLAELIYAEAGGGSSEMKYAVGSVVLNRIASERFPDTMSEVIFQEGQYESAPILGKTDESCREVAADLIENGVTIPETCVWSAEFPQGDGIYRVIGNQFICY